MPGAATQRQPALDPAWLEPSAEQTREGFKNSKTENTRRAYRADWSDFTNWCSVHDHESLPANPSTVARYLSELAHSAKLATLRHRLAAIGHAHLLAGYDSPTRAPLVRQFIAEIRRLDCTPSSKKPVLIEDLRRMVSAIPGTPLGLRDRALLLLGFTGAFRRSELVALDCEDIRPNPHGLIVTIRRSKMDQETPGRSLCIPHGSANEGTCPIAALEHWLIAARIESGSIFRAVNRHGQVLSKRLSAAAVAIVVKRWVQRLGYDANDFAGHSLRAGLATSAAIAGKSERAIMRQTGHRSVASVRRYIRGGDLFRENAAEGLGL